MKEGLRIDIENVISSGNTVLSGLDVIDDEVRVYLQSDIFSNHGETTSPDVMIKMDKEGK